MRFFFLTTQKVVLVLVLTREKFEEKLKNILALPQSEKCVIRKDMRKDIHMHVYILICVCVNTRITLFELDLGLSGQHSLCNCFKWGCNTFMSHSTILEH